MVDKRAKLSNLLKDSNHQPKKYMTTDKRTVVVMPSPIQKKDMTDYSYGLDIDKKVIEMVANLAERMAVSLVRETLSLNTDEIVDRICDKLIERLPELTVKEAIYNEKPTIKKDVKQFVVDTSNIKVDRSDGYTVSGDIGRKVNTEDSTKDALEALEKFI